jgi:hypothetical protein
MPAVGVRGKSSLTVGEHGQSTEILKGTFRRVEIQRFKKCGLDGERFT